MPQRKTHADPFKKDAVRRLMAGGSKTIAEIAAEVGVSQSMLHSRNYGRYYHDIGMVRWPVRRKYWRLR